MVDNDKALSFEQALLKLEKIVERMEVGQVPLAEAVDLYEKGVLLKKTCEKQLNEAKIRIDKIMADDDGIPTAVPMGSAEES